MTYKLNVDLVQNPEIIKEKFKSLSNFNDVANILEIPSSFLRQILIVSKKSNYGTFTIKKKSGDDRKIHAPSKNLLIIQKKLTSILNLVYKNHENSHGFIKDRSIITNANKHIRKQYVLNFDLEDFFNNINFGRVRAMFIYYFKFNEDVATILANICCHYDGFLPQGAPTSPIISNILANKLDKDLTRLAKRHRCDYTRYAADISISTNKDKFPKAIAHTKDRKTYLSSEIINIVKNNGFFINDKKSRLHSKSENLSVTGLTVNEGLNVKRSYIRRVRSILNCIEQNLDNLDEAKRIFIEKYPFRQISYAPEPDMFAILKGMITHIGHIKGKTNSVYRKLAIRYNDIAEIISYTDIEESENIFPIKLPSTRRQFQETNTFVIEPSFVYKNGDDEEFEPCGQGTGFLLKGIGIVTNAHLFDNFLKKSNDGYTITNLTIEVHQSKYSTNKKYAKLLWHDRIKDVAILQFTNGNLTDQGFDYNTSIKTGMEIELLGYPAHTLDNSIKIESGVVRQERNNIISDRQKQTRFEISPLIYGGNSGGPVVNEENQVIAIATRGITSNGVVPSEVVPIGDAIALFEKHNPILTKNV
ncbi:reverse transcriptase domain-containing protein [Bacillus cereus group sp. BfR-BA-01495]|uniref:reverse transcriptase domain-containing protein n=1 Tax=Bacillus cereus group sp. BfR-BA-01495 TaxID=2920363 RepID=UPI001F59702A|nr:reverse transcriptase domain-containing protein [Bacillus cereus group sp. BfR-BA-01495]